MKIIPLLAALCVSLTTSTSFAALADFAGKFKGTTLTTFTETNPPTYTEDVTVTVKQKGKGNAGTLVLTSQSQVPGNEKMVIAVKLARSGSGSAIVNNPGAGVANLSIPWNAKIKQKKFSVTSTFLLFGMFPTDIAMSLKVKGKKLVGLVTFTRLDTGAQVVTSNFVIKRSKSK